VGNKIRAILPL